MLGSLLCLWFSEKHLVAHEEEEAVTVLNWWDATDCVLVVNDALTEVFESLLLSIHSQNVDDAHKVDARAIRGDQPTFLRLKESLCWSLPFVRQHLLHRLVNRLGDFALSQRLLGFELGFKHVFDALDIKQVEVGTAFNNLAGLQLR